MKLIFLLLPASFSFSSSLKQPVSLPALTHGSPSNQTDFFPPQTAVSFFLVTYQILPPAPNPATVAASVLSTAAWESMLRMLLSFQERKKATQSPVLQIHAQLWFKFWMHLMQKSPLLSINPQDSYCWPACPHRHAEVQFQRHKQGGLCCWREPSPGLCQHHHSSCLHVCSEYSKPALFSEVLLLGMQPLTALQLGLLGNSLWHYTEKAGPVTLLPALAPHSHSHQSAQTRCREAALANRLLLPLKIQETRNKTKTESVWTSCNGFTLKQIGDGGTKSHVRVEIALLPCLGARWGGLSPAGLVATVMSDPANAEGRRWKLTQEPPSWVTPGPTETQMQFLMSDDSKK